MIFSWSEFLICSWLRSDCRRWNSARDEAVRQDFADGVLVDLQDLRVAGASLRGSGLVDEERLVQILRRPHVGPLPAFDDAERQALLGERLPGAAVAARQEERAHHRGADSARRPQPAHPPQKRLAGERIEDQERHERRGGEEQVPHPDFVGVGVGGEGPAQPPFQPGEEREREQCARGQGHERGGGARQRGPEEEPVRHRVTIRPEGAVDQLRLVHPAAVEVVIPGSRLQVEVEIESEGEPRESEIGGPLRPQPHLLPVSIFLIDVRTRLLAGGALRALRAGSLAQAGGFGVDLLDQRDRAEVIAPGLAGEDRAGGHCGAGDEEEEHRAGLPDAIDEGQPQPQSGQQETEDDEVVVLFEPRRCAPRSGAPEHDRDLAEDGERADAAPAVIADEEDEERQPGDHTDQRTCAATGRPIPK
jgi:hypothetical protein